MINVKKACSYKPGWFIPGEVEKVAEFLEISTQELFNTKLLVDYYENSSTEDILVLSPGIKNYETGTKFPDNPLGECVFFKNGLCEIHEVKPFECKITKSCEPFTFNGSIEDHEKIARIWDTKKNQKFVETLWDGMTLDRI